MVPFQTYTDPKMQVLFAEQHPEEMLGFNSKSGQSSSWIISVMNKPFRAKSKQTSVRSTPESPLAPGPPPPASLLENHKVCQLDRIFTATKFYTYLVAEPATRRYLTTDDKFLTALTSITEVDDCYADLVVEAYEKMKDGHRSMMIECIKVVEAGLERDGTEKLQEWIKIEKPKIWDEEERANEEQEVRG
jgi:hypothetical protein